MSGDRIYGCHSPFYLALKIPLFGITVKCVWRMRYFDKKRTFNYFGAV